MIEVQRQYIELSSNYVGYQHQSRLILQRLQMVPEHRHLSEYG